MSRGIVATTIAALAMILTLLGGVLTLFLPIARMDFLAAIGNMAGAVVAAFVIGRAVLAPGTVTPHRVIGAIVVYLNFGLFFTTAYRLLWDLDRTSLSGVPSGTEHLHAAGMILCFSFVTLTTVGYGDIVPLHPLARSLANLQGIVGQLYPATLLARLITLELEAGRR